VVPSTVSGDVSSSEETEYAQDEQIIAWVEDKPGNSANYQALGNAKVNITAWGRITRQPAVNAPSGSNQQPCKSEKVLEKLGVRITRSRSPAIRFPIARRVGRNRHSPSQANINIEFAYATTTKGSKKSDVVLAVSDWPRHQALRGCSHSGYRG